MKSVMLSHVTRADTSRASSLRQLAAADIFPTIIESTADKPSDAEVRRRGHDALTLADGADLLFLEDDIAVRPALLRQHLELARLAGTTTALCAINPRHYPPGVLNEVPMRVRLVAIPGYAANRGFHGSMALFIPAKLASYGAAHPEQFMRADGEPLDEPAIPPDHERNKVTGFDFWVKWAAQDFGGMLVALPNSVDHDDRGSVGGATRRPWRSPTFTRAAA